MATGARVLLANVVRRRGPAVRGVRGGGWGERWWGEEADALPVRARVLLRSKAPAGGLEAAQAHLLYCKEEEGEGEGRALSYFASEPAFLTLPQRHLN